MIHFHFSLRVNVQKGRWALGTIDFIRRRNNEHSEQYGGGNSFGPAAPGRSSSHATGLWRADVAGAVRRRQTRGRGLTRGWPEVSGQARRRNPDARTVSPQGVAKFGERRRVQ